MEASSSELPAKFHESHVHLQELEKNQTALWNAVHNVTSTLQLHSTKVSVISKLKIKKLIIKNSFLDDLNPHKLESENSYIKTVRNLFF